MMRFAYQTRIVMCENNSINHVSLNKNSEILEICQFLSNKIHTSSCAINAKSGSILKVAIRNVAQNKKSANSKGKTSLRSLLKSAKGSEEKTTRHKPRLLNYTRNL